MIKERILILDLYLLDLNNQIAIVDRKVNDPILANTLTMIILSLPLGNHPIAYVRQYLTQKGLITKSIDLLPAMYLNNFDSEPDKEYLVTSYKAVVTESKPLNGDSWNPEIKWMNFDTFIAHPKLMAEFQKCNIKDLLRSHGMYYQGYYRDSDSSNEILKWEPV